MKINTKHHELQGLLEILKKNILLAFVYPILILLHLYYLNLYTNNNLLELFIIISLLNQFDIGLIKNTFFYKKKYNLLLLVMIFMACLVLLSFLSMSVFLLFDSSFQFLYIFIVFIGLIGNEFKSFYDSQSNYLIGFIIKNILNISVIYLFYNMLAPFFLPILILISLLAFLSFTFLYVKLNLETKKFIHYSDLKFFFLNIFSYLSGNIDRFLVIPFIALPLRNTYLYFTETNNKLYGIFGFLNNLFLYKQIKLSLRLILIIGTFLLISIFIVCFIFSIDYTYITFSLYLCIGVFSQYYVYSKIGDLKGLSISFFPVIGMSIYLVLFYFTNKFFNINLLILAFLLAIKSLSELTFIYIINIIKLKQSN
jgi:hypothetical protein